VGAGFCLMHFVDHQRLFFILHGEGFQPHAVKIVAHLLVSGLVDDDLVISGVGLKARGDIHGIANGGVILQAFARADVADGCYAGVHPDAILDFDAISDFGEIGVLLALALCFAPLPNLHVVC